MTETAFKPNPLQAMRGQPWQSHEASPMLYAALEWISRKLQTVLWNRMQREVRHPFHKDSGTAFQTEGLTIYGSRDWDGEERPHHWNLKCGDVEISWYRHSWCWASVNKPLSNDEISAFLETALAILKRCDVDHDYYGKKGEQTFYFDGEEIGESSMQRACREERGAKRKKRRDSDTRPKDGDAKQGPTRE